MVEFNEGQLKRISFHLLTLKNPKARRNLIKSKVDAANFFCLEPRQLELTGLVPAEVKVVRERGWSVAESEVSRLKKNHIEIIFREDSDYPPLLAQIYDPPDLIYFTGNREILAKSKLAVVGSRRGSAYGQTVLNRILPECCQAGLVIVSGMAYGIAGIARAVLVVEAALRSGSLITARLALEQNRDVMAVPGNIDSSLSQGTNYLLQQGAKLICSAADLLLEFGLSSPARHKIEMLLSAKEKKILDLCGENEVKGIDFLVETLDFSPAETISLLMGLVLKNLLVEEAGGYRRIVYE
jgi:predicted Rossmann fold nucleotide-binding protein DprA/Smf involved in DNA uptake